MATMVNMIPVDAKPIAAPQNTSKKGSTTVKSTLGFAKVLHNQADKKEVDDVTSTAKEDSTDQLLAAMTGLVLPVSMNATIQNQESDQVAAGLTTGATKVQEVNPMQVDTKNPLLNLVQADKGQLPELASQATVELGSTIGMNTSQNQLSLLLAKMTNTPADSKKSNEFAQLQSQVLAQVQVKQMVEQLQQTNIAGNTVDDLTNNAALLEIVPTLAVVDVTNGTGKILGTSMDNKKIVTEQGNVETTKVADFAELVGTVDVKPLAVPQSIASIAEAVTSDGNSAMLLVGDKEKVNIEPLLADQTEKNGDIFANLLNQQVVKSDIQVTVSEVKQMPQQPVADSYNITSQIVDQARLIEGTKNTEMIIQLKPEHLGELILKVTVENGVVNASFHSNNSEVRNIIEASIQQLKQDMSNQGLKVENVSVYAGLGQFFSDGQRESQKKPEVKVQNKKNEKDFLEALESGSSIESVSDVSGVDYRI